MPRKRSIKIRCPICKEHVTTKSPYFPFCSEHCKTIDLGKWATGAYVISSPVHDISESVEDLPAEPDEE